MKRIWYIDFIRTFAILWIVLIFHNSLVPNNIFFNSITIGLLGSFTLISGILLGYKKYDYSNIKNIFVFYFSRIKRLYIFFLLSALIFYIFPTFDLYINSTKQFIHTITFLACFFKDLPLTIWYICVIFIFYLFTPIILYKENKKYQILISILLYIFFLYLYFLNFLDGRILIYFPIFSYGLIYGSLFNQPSLFFSNKKNEILILIILYILLLFIRCVCLKSLQELDIINVCIFSIIFIKLIKEFSIYIEKNSTKSVFIFKYITSYIAFASLLIYLFHRHYNYLVDEISKYININCLFLRFILFPLFILIMYNIQKIYNKLIYKNK